MLKENSSKSFFQKSSDTNFLVLTNRSKSKFKKKVANLYGVSSDFYLKPIPLKKVFLNQTAKAVSVTMVAKNEKMTPRISCPFTHFLEIQPSFFRNRGWDGTMRTLWKSFNALSDFWFWNSFVRYFNPGISFVIFSLHISGDEMNIFLDSNCIDIVTKFCHIKVVFS